MDHICDEEMLAISAELEDAAMIAFGDQYDTSPSQLGGGVTEGMYLCLLFLVLFSLSNTPFVFPSRSF